MDIGSWQAAVHSVAKSRTRLKQLSMHAFKKQVNTICSMVGRTAKSNHKGAYMQHGRIFATVFINTLPTACMLHLVTCFVPECTVEVTVCDLGLCLNGPWSFHSCLLRTSRGKRYYEEMGGGHSFQQSQWLQLDTWVEASCQSPGIPPTDCKGLNETSRHHVMHKNFPYELSQTVCMCVFSVMSDPLQPHGL